MGMGIQICEALGDLSCLPTCTSTFLGLVCIWTTTCWLAGSSIPRATGNSGKWDQPKEAGQGFECNTGSQPAHSPLLPSCHEVTCSWHTLLLPQCSSQPRGSSHRGLNSRNRELKELLLLSCCCRHLSQQREVEDLLHLRLEVYNTVFYLFPETVLSVLCNRKPLCFPPRDSFRPSKSILPSPPSSLKEKLLYYSSLKHHSFKKATTLL